MDREQIIDQLLNAFLAVRQTLEQQIQAINGQIEQTDREQITDQLLNAFVTIRQTLEQQIQAINGQTDQARLEYLKDLLDRQQRELADWLAEIDQSLIDCCEYIQEYQRLYTDVSVLSAKISQLAGVSPPVVAPLPADSLESAIMARIQHLRGERKI